MHFKDSRLDTRLILSWIAAARRLRWADVWHESREEFRRRGLEQLLELFVAKGLGNGVFVLVCTPTQ